MQIRTYVSLVSFVLKFPMRWPQLYQVLRQNIRILLTWPVLVIGVFTTGLWTLHVVLSRLVWPQAHVTWNELASDVPWLALTSFFGIVMVTLDGWALLRVSRFHPPRVQWLLTATEFGLRSSSFGGALRLLVGWHLRTRLVRRLPMLMQWTLRRSAEVTARICVGLCLWAGWALGRAV